MDMWTGYGISGVEGGKRVGDMTGYDGGTIFEDIIS